MELQTKKLVYDLDQAVQRITDFVHGRTFEDYTQDSLLRSAVERQFEIIGEALSRLHKVNPDIVGQILDYQRIIAFRNVLAHGYDTVSDQTVWDIIAQRVPVLRAEIDLIKQKIDMQ